MYYNYFRSERFVFFKSYFKLVICYRIINFSILWQQKKERKHRRRFRSEKLQREKQREEDKFLWFRKTKTPDSEFLFYML